MRAVIFANGKIENIAPITKMLSNDDFIIAADGGINHVLTISKLPNAVIGDLDSISPEMLRIIEENNIPTEKHKRDKDQSDLELAIHYAMNLGYQEIIIFGALGNRWDHSVGNLLLPSNKSFQSLDIQFWADGEHFYYVTKSFSKEVPIDTPVSLFPIRDCKNIITSGLQYPLKNESLLVGTSRGLSNIADNSQIIVTLNKGTLLCIIGSKDKS